MKEEFHKDTGIEIQTNHIRKYQRSATNDHAATNITDIDWLW